MLARASPTSPKSTSSARVATAAAYVVDEPEQPPGPEVPVARAASTAAVSRLSPPQATAEQHRGADVETRASDVPRRRTSGHTPRRPGSRSPTHHPLTRATVERWRSACSRGATGARDERALHRLGSPASPASWPGGSSPGRSPRTRRGRSPGRLRSMTSAATALPSRRLARRVVALVDDHAPRRGPPAAGSAGSPTPGRRRAAPAAPAGTSCGCVAARGRGARPAGGTGRPGPLREAPTSSTVCVASRHHPDARGRRRGHADASDGA